MTSPPLRPDAAFLFSHPAHFIALGLGSGLAKRAPGTWGTLAALPLYALLNLGLAPQWIAMLCIPVFILGAWAAGKTCADLGVEDYGGVVVDEIVAMWLVLAVAPATFWGWFSAFVLFRVFDIAKPWPIAWLDARVPGGFGVMLDDLFAAFYSVLVLLIFQKTQLIGF